MKCQSCGFVNFETRESCAKCGVPLPTDESDEFSASLDELSTKASAPPTSTPAPVQPAQAPVLKKTGPNKSAIRPAHKPVPAATTPQPEATPAAPRPSAPVVKKPEFSEETMAPEPIASQADLDLELSGDYPEPQIGGPGTNKPIQPESRRGTTEEVSASTGENMRGNTSEDVPEGTGTGTTLEFVEDSTEVQPGELEIVNDISGGDGIEILDLSREIPGSETGLLGTAPASRRILALLIDMTILSSLTLLFFLIALLVGDYTGKVDPADITQTFYAYIGPLGFLLGILYFTWFWGSSGQSPGKMATGLVVVANDGRPLGFGRAFVRAVGYWISSLVFMLGFIWGLIAKGGKTWHDHMSGSRVICREDDRHQH